MFKSFARRKVISKHNNDMVQSCEDFSDQFFTHNLHDWPLYELLCSNTYPSITTRHVWLYSGTFDAHIAIVRGTLPIVVILPSVKVSVPVVTAHHTCKAVRVRQHELSRHFVRPRFEKCQNTACMRNQSKRLLVIEPVRDKDPFQVNLTLCMYA